MNLILNEWTENDYLEFVGFLKSQADEKYRNFHSSLVPGAEKSDILGIRMPRLREIGREISKGNARSFLAVSKSVLYEERMVRGIVTGLIKTKDFDDFTALVDNFSNEVDNWAICDCFCAGIKEIKKYKSEFFDYIQKYLNSNNDWKIRVALVVMLDYYLEDEYIDEVLKRCDNVKSTYYYVSMAKAWLVATAAAKCKDETMEYLHNNSLDDETFNKAIQKCIESRRIDDKTKSYLRTLKRKKV